MWEWGLDSSGSGQGTLADACVHGKEPLGFIKVREFHVPLSDHQLIHSPLYLPERINRLEDISKIRPIISAAQFTKNEMSCYYFWKCFEDSHFTQTFCMCNINCPLPVHCEICLITMRKHRNNLCTRLPGTNTAQYYPSTPLLQRNVRSQLGGFRCDTLYRQAARMVNGT